MNHYVIYREIQSIIEDAFKNRRHPLQPAQVAAKLDPHAYPTVQKPFRMKHRLWCNLTDDEFEQLFMDSACLLNENEDYTQYFQEIQSFDENIIFESYNFTGSIMVSRHFNFAEEKMHTNRYFELFYVFRGKGELTLQGRTLSLVPGNFCIIPPGLPHSMEIRDETAFVLDISIRASNFEQTFFSQLAQDNILSLFFRTSIYEKKIPDYLMFSTGESRDLKMLLKNLAMECFLSDSGNDFSAISAANLLFAFLLRNFKTELQFAGKDYGTDFSLILQYMQVNSSTATLEEVAGFFNYSKQYLCRIIRQNTGYTFNELIHIQRLNKAISLMKKTGYSLEQIAEITGYNSADHFSRTFKKYYHCSPSEYRKKIREEGEAG